MIARKIKYPNLAAEIARSGKSFDEVSKELGMSAQALHRRLRGSTKFRKSEIDKLCEILSNEYNYLFKEL